MLALVRMLLVVLALPIITYERWCVAEESMKAASRFLMATLPSLMEGTRQNGAAAAAMTLQAATLNSLADATQKVLSEAELAAADGSSSQESAAGARLQLPMLVSLLGSLGACLDQPDQALEPSAEPDVEVEAFALADGSEPDVNLDSGAEAPGNSGEALTAAGVTANGNVRTEGTDSTEDVVQHSAKGQHGTAQEQSAAQTSRSADMSDPDPQNKQAHAHPAGDGDIPAVDAQQPEPASSATDLAAAVAAVREHCLQVTRPWPVLVLDLLRCDGQQLYN